VEPILIPPKITPEPPPVPRWRWLIHLILLTAYPLGLGGLALIGSRLSRSASQVVQPILPGDVSGLLAVAGFEVGLFGLVFGLAWLCSRAGPAQLMLCWRGGFRPVTRGLIYSVALRLAIGIGLLIVVVLLQGFGLIDKHSVEAMRPRFEAIVDPGALHSPIYLIVVLTLISFVVAGLREELWRAGMFAAMRELLPNRTASKWGSALAMAVIALVFGAGHLPQGVMGMVLTAFLGFGLGWIMLRHDSIWEAVIAHGFFDATTFLLLALIGSRFSQIG